MEFKLCYRTYKAKVSLGAMRKFKEATGGCLWSFLIAYNATSNKAMRTCETVGDVCAELCKSADFVTASHAFHAMCEDSAVGIDEIQDAMFHSGVYPSTKDTDLAEPWTVILSKLSQDFIASLEGLRVAKKPEADS